MRWKKYSGFNNEWENTRRGETMELFNNRQTGEARPSSWFVLIKGWDWQHSVPFSTKKEAMGYIQKYKKSKGHD